MSAHRPLFAGLLLGITACGGGEPTGPSGTPSRVPTTVTLSATTVSFASLLDTHQLTATVSDQNGATMSGAPVSWTSSNTQVATVSSAGVVTALSIGSATITASSGSASGTASVTVQQVAVSISLSPDSIVLAGPGDTAQVTASVKDGGGSPIVSPIITWSSSDEGVATVNSSGIVTAISQGTATMTATSEGVSGAATIVVEEELSAFMKDYIAAIFLGSGPLIPQDNATACVTHPGKWAAFPRGTTVRVIASNSLDQGSDGEDTKMLLQAALARVEQATHGAVTTTFQTTNDPDPMPGTNEATATDHPDPLSTGCAFDRGCVHIAFNDVGLTEMRSSRTVLKEAIQPSDAFVHDVVGHGIMGMCHIDQALIGGNDKSLMAGGPGAFTGFIPDGLSPLDVAAARAVYGTTLEPGATLADFQAAGLVRPGITVTSPLPSPVTSDVVRLFRRR